MKNAFRYDLIIDQVKQKSDEYKSFKVLDCGTGPGFLTNYFQEQTGCALTGIDISENMIELTKAITNENIQFKKADLNESLVKQLNDEKFDIAFSVYVLCYIKNEEVMESWFKNIYDALTPGASFMSITDDPDHFKNPREIGKKKMINSNSSISVSDEMLEAGKFVCGSTVEFNLYNEQGESSFKAVNHVYSERTWKKVLEKVGFRNIQFIRYPEYHHFFMIRAEKLDTVCI